MAFIRGMGFSILQPALQTSHIEERPHLYLKP
jgi:hypothetical protein